jgi:hypothetical protein
MMPAYATPHSTERDGQFRSARSPRQKSASIFFVLWLSRNTRAGIWPLRSAGMTT